MTWYVWEQLQEFSAYMHLKRKQDDRLDSNEFKSAPSQWKQTAVPFCFQDILGKRKQLLKQLLGYISMVWRRWAFQQDQKEICGALSVLNLSFNPMCMPKEELWDSSASL